MKKVFLAAVLMVMLLANPAAALAAPTPPAPPAAPAKPAPAKPAPAPAAKTEKQETLIIKYGARGDEVKMVQRLLAETGYYAGEIDGVFGSGTHQAVKDFQAYNRLSPDGVVGKETIAFLQRERGSAEPSRYSRVATMTATAYTSEDDGNGNMTYRGNQLRRGLVAVDPRVIPLGTRLFIKGYGFAVADDIGGAIKGNRIDLAFESRADALQFGVQKVTVYILD